MKQRLGFISNSSSSSFVLRVGAPFDNALDVAEYMIPKREWEEHDIELLEKIKNIRDDRSIKQPNAVCFPSCNYDTFIAKMGEYFLIETCHNHDWKLGDIYVQRPQEFSEYFGDDSFYELPHKIDFYNLEYGIVGRELDWNLSSKYESSWCPSCYRNLWIVDGNVMCPKCKKQPTKKKSRK